MPQDLIDFGLSLTMLLNCRYEHNIKGGKNKAWGRCWFHFYGAGKRASIVWELSI